MPCGSMEPDLGCPVLCVSNQFAQKLLANSDRSKDSSTLHRDIFDLGMLMIAGSGQIPPQVAAKPGRL